MTTETTAVEHDLLIQAGSSVVLLKITGRLCGILELETSLKSRCVWFAALSQQLSRAGRHQAGPRAPAGAR